MHWECRTEAVIDSSFDHEGWECATEDGRIRVATGDERTIFPANKIKPGSRLGVIRFNREPVHDTLSALQP